ncbi:MAG TPA: exodeoxyribonuclease V subunit alpha [Pasteurellaceae bacterium]|nr:exodeoxyribonuclease V subunit alpha [Pasteurellaceae bacterium]
MKGYRADCVAQVLQSAVENYADFLHYIQSLSAQNAQLEDNILAEVFAKFNSVRFLTALRTGEFGVEQLNQSIAEKLRQKGLLQFKHSRDWYLGQPVMVNRNDNNVGLFNGDIGIYLGNRRVWFETGDGYKSVSISRVPSHETAFVMTVHKSQGSEFPHTFLVLPTENSPILSKELIYTALTRAKKQLTVFTAENIWKSAVRNPIKRQSGLGNLLSINNRA